MIDYAAIGKNIRKCRRENGMTQEDVAEKLGVTPDYVSKVENAQKHPSLKLLDRLAILYNMDMSEFITGINPEHDNYGMPKFFGIIKDFEPETKILLLKTAQSFAEIDEALKKAKK